MLAEDLLKQGQLDQALAGLQNEVRKAPAEVKKRIFLVQVLMVLGQWDRALTQLKVIADLDAGTLPMVHTYREAIRCEVLRGEVFAGKATPLVFGDPERWVALLLEALRLGAEGHFEQAQTLRDEAFDLAPATAGTLNGQKFEWLADADPRLGPVIEAVVNGAYYWIPVHRIREIRIGDPEDLRDVVWTPVEFAWSNGGETVGLIPTRYPGSEKCADERIRLSRMTEWQEPAPGLFIGSGQRMLATDAGEFPILDVRQIVLESQEPEATGAGATGATDG